MATSATPHICLFVNFRKLTSGVSSPCWLSTLGPVFVRRNVRTSKYDSPDEEQLTHFNLAYTRVRVPDGWRETVSIRQLALFSIYQLAPAPTYRTLPLVPHDGPINDTSNLNTETNQSSESDLSSFLTDPSTNMLPLHERLTLTIYAVVRSKQILPYILHFRDTERRDNR